MFSRNEWKVATEADEDVLARGDFSKAYTRSYDSVGQKAFTGAIISVALRGVSLAQELVCIGQRRIPSAMRRKYIRNCRDEGNTVKVADVFNWPILSRWRTWGQVQGKYRITQKFSLLFRYRVPADGLRDE